MTENIREANFSLQSGIDMRNMSANENNLSHLNCFRTPSVVVSDHSEETGCLAYDDIRRIHLAHNRKRKSKTGRRHSVDANERYDHRRRSELIAGDLTDTNETEFYKSSLNVTRFQRRKNGNHRVDRKSMSLEEDLGGFEFNFDLEKKSPEQFNGSNELSCIASQCESSNFGGGSSQNSPYNDISPIFSRRNVNFNEISKNHSDFGYNYSSSEPQAPDDFEFFLLERQRSVSYDDLYMDSSAASDVSYTDLSTDFSACSSLSNLAGTLYHRSYDPAQDYSLNSQVSIKFNKSNEFKNGNIKTSRSCSDFLSVSRIADYYPHMKCRRHSNDQVAIDVSQCRPKKEGSRDGTVQKRWMNARLGSTKFNDASNIICIDEKLCARMKMALGRMNSLHLKSFHESLDFKRESYSTPIRRSISNESFFSELKASESTGDSYSSESTNFHKAPTIPTMKIKRFEKSCSKAKIMELENCSENQKLKKKWLSVRWRSEDSDGTKDEIFRKVSDCSTCSINSEYHNGITGSFGEMNARAKSSGWRKLRNIVQWTPFFQTYKKQRYPWVQLAGHQGNFKAGPEQGTILKKLCPKEEKCYKILMKDALRPYVPEYKGQVTCDESECIYLQLEDLLVDFNAPCVLDCKLGVRTYLEEELQKAKEKPKLRKDMYDKMIQIDPTAPTIEEHRLKAVTKPRYMIWRETISSTSTLGFRLEGVRKSDGKSSKDFKTTRAKEEVKEAFREFVDGFPHATPKYVQRLKAIKATLEVSIFFSSHEIIGSSLLFVHDKVKANIWMIDFAKTLMLPEQTFIDHKSKWEMGNHEDGYLIGIGNLIEIFSELEEEQKFNQMNMRMTTSEPLTESSATFNSSDEI